MKKIYIDSIAKRVGVKDWQVENCAALFEEGATIPFISRYRMERTGGLDDVAVAEVRHWVDVYNEMEKRKETVLETISQAGALTSDLRSRIENCVETRELEDLYLPFKPKRRTRELERMPPISSLTRAERKGVCTRFSFGAIIRFLNSKGVDAMR